MHDLQHTRPHRPTSPSPAEYQAAMSTCKLLAGFLLVDAGLLSGNIALHSIFACLDHRITLFFACTFLDELLGFDVRVGDVLLDQGHIGTTIQSCECKIEIVVQWSGGNCADRKDREEKRFHHHYPRMNNQKLGLSCGPH